MPREQTPYLLQRGTIRRNAPSGAVFSDAVTTDYMGRAEYEYGAMPKSLRRIQSRFEAFSVRPMTGLLDVKERPLLAFGDWSDLDFAHFEAGMRDIVDEKARALCYTNLDEALWPKPFATFKRAKRGEKQSEIQNPPYGTVHFYPNNVRTRAQRADYERNYDRQRTDFWWDLGCDVMLSLNTEFMARLPEHLQASFALMDQKASPDRESARSPALR